MAGNLIIDRVAKTPTATTTDLVRGLAKAWANLNGTGTVALRNSLNVASVIDNGVGQFFFSYTSGMANDGTSTVKWDNQYTIGAAVPTATRAEIYVRDISGGSFPLFDASALGFSTQGDLA